MRIHNTKFVCTLGPSSDSPEILEKMISHGMDVARLNFSHGSYKHHELLIKNVRKVANKLKVPVAIMQDLQGPKIRVGKIADTEVKKGKEIVLNCGPQVKDQIPVQYKNLSKYVKKGNVLLVDDGLIELKVQKVSGKKIYCKPLNSGIIKSNKGINVPNAGLKINPITSKDKKDLKFGIKNDVDYVALSFVNNAKNIRDLKKLIPASKNIKVIAKIERASAIENLNEIIKASDGIMVARGDLALEIGPEKVPIIQKKIINLCNLAGKPVITATHMLQSMVENPNPTRAEVSDIANAIFDHSDAIMLSNETAVGKYPVRAISIFAKVAKITEKELKKNMELIPVMRTVEGINSDDALGYEACDLAETLNSDKIIVLTKNGYLAGCVSKHRSYIPTIVIAENKKTYNQLALYWGINKIIVDKVRKQDYLKDIRRILKAAKVMKKGEKAVIFYSDRKEKRIVSTAI